MTFLDLFAGVGGFRRGMELAGHRCVGFCEWDKFATASYTSMHLITSDQRERLAKLSLKARQKEILKEDYRNGEWYSADVRLIRCDNVPKADCWCFGAPCQDFSIAGHRKGLDGDRSSLVREVFRILDELEPEDKPEWLIYENVKGMLSSNRGGDFAAIILEMEQLGYDIEWQLFNTKYFGIPQNRERVYVVGHLRTRGRKSIFPLKGTDEEDSVPIEIMGHRDGYRRNTQVFAPEGVTEALSTAAGGGRGHHVGIPVSFGIDFNPAGEERTISNTLTSRYYKGMASRKQSEIAVAIPVLTPDRPVKRQNGRRFKENGEEAFTLTAQDRHGVAIGIEDIQANRGFNQRNVVHSPNGISRTLIGCSQGTGSGNEPEVAVPIKEAVAKGYTDAHEGDSINLSVPNSNTRRGRVGNQVALTLDTACNQGILVKLNDNTTVYAVLYEKYQCYIAIRKLTPRECFRLQGWTDECFDRAAFVNSDSQLYKQAGNGVTVAVVEDIGKAIKNQEEKE